MGEYEHNLEHLAEPARPNDRELAVSATFADYEALWLTEALREFAHYGDHDTENQGSIAVAYASYIDQQVRERGESYVTVYAHTELAASTLMDALYFYLEGDREGVPMQLARSAENTLATLFSHYVEATDNEHPPTPVVDEVDGTWSVTFEG